jgi:O-antigen ligase
MANIFSNALKEKATKDYLFFFLLLAALPFVFIPNLPDQILPPQITFLAILLLIFFTLFSFEKNFTGLIKDAFTKPSIVVWTLFTSSTIVSLFYAHNPAEGLYETVKTFASLVLLIIFTVLFTKNRINIKVIGIIIMFTAAIAVSIGLKQYVNFAATKTGAELYHALYKVTGLFGHKNELSITLFLTLPWLFFIVSRLKGVWRVVSIIVIISNLLLILILQTRSVWLGLFASIIGYVILISLTGMKNTNHEVLHKRIARSLLSVSVIVFLVLSTLVAVHNFTNKDSVLSFQLSGITNIMEHRNLERYSIWRSTLKMYSDNPIGGVGAGNWKIHIPVYQNDYLLKRDPVETDAPISFQTWLRPHNDFLWILAERGPLGLIFYLSFFSLIFFNGIRVLQKEIPSAKTKLISLLMCSLAGYLVIALLTFPHERVSHQVFIMAAASLIISQSKASLSIGKPFKSAFIRSAKLVLISLLVFSTVYGVLLMRSGYYLSRAIDPTKTTNAMEVLRFIDKAQTPLTTLDAFSIPLKYYSGLTYMRANELELAEEELLKAHIQHPNHIKLNQTLALLYMRKGDIDKSENYIRRALAIFPFNDPALMRLAAIFYLKEDYDAAYQTLLRCSNSSGNRDFDRINSRILEQLNQVD